ncbi:MAG: GNAT family N-acetyltransferase [Acidobacteriota bacterium]|nr:GNAT family N-acetyltransferase [Acidobacteriota bacterium]
MKISETKKITEIETERIRLRQFTMDDLDDLARVFASPQVMRFLGLNCEPMTREETETALVSIIRHWERNGFGRWAVVSKEDDRLIGCAGLRSCEGLAELVYLLDETYWGKGLATEIAAACLRYGFEYHNFPSIIAMTRPGNERSQNVLHKIGMHFEKETTAFGIFVFLYSISREEYYALNPER